MKGKKLPVGNANLFGLFQLASWSAAAHGIGWLPSTFYTFISHGGDDPWPVQRNRLG